MHKEILKKRFIGHIDSLTKGQLTIDQLGL